MSLVLELAVAAGAGLVIGLAFFGGLWLTVARLDAAPLPLARLLASMIARFALALGGFYVLARYGGWQHVVAGALGFTVVRVVLAARAARRGRGEEADA